MTGPVQQTPATSQKLWNPAYDSLKEDEGTANLVTAYMTTLGKVVRIGTTEAPDFAATDVSTDLDNPEARQRYMEMLVHEGKRRIAKASKITKALGDFAKLVLSAKGMVDLVVQNFPQAALPWAGVCAGLQVGRHALRLLWFSGRLTGLDPYEPRERHKIQPCGHRPRRVPNGLVLCLDGASPKQGEHQDRE